MQRKKYFRQTGMGSSSTFARIGSVLAPIVGRELGKHGRVIPILIFGACAALGGFLTLLLPETHGHVLPESIEEGERHLRVIHTIMKNSRQITRETYDRFGNTFIANIFSHDLELSI
jgi:hypothetical protein